MAGKYDFQYCPKITLFDTQDRVLLARRKGEADFDDVYSLIGGKMETTDDGLLEGILREKQEEIGRRALILVAPQLSYNVRYIKKDGNVMILPHIYGQYIEGAIELNEDEYSNYVWASPEELDTLEPKIETIPDAVKWARRIREIIQKDDLIEIQ